MKRTLSFVLSVALLLSVLCAVGFETYALPSSGSCGADVKYAFNSSTKVLTVSGKGEMYDYDNNQNKSPFNASVVETVVINDGVTSIGSYAFYNCMRSKSVTIPKSVKSIGASAFVNNTQLSVVDYKGSESEWNRITGEGKDSIPSSAEIKFNYACEHQFVTDTVEKADATNNLNGKLNKKCKFCGVAGKSTVIYCPKTITLSKTKYVYDPKAKARKPTVDKVTDTKGKTIASKYYDVSYANGRKEVGRYAVKVKFKGHYKGTLTKSFVITPKPTSFTTVSPFKKGICLGWKSISGVSGYNYQVATDKDFKNVVKDQKLSYEHKGVNQGKLKGGKTYYVRIRTYKYAGDDYKPIYSSWSKTKSAKTKK